MAAILPITIDHLRSRALFELPPPPMLFHYTNLDGVSGILSSKSLWLSKVNTTNDTSEMNLATMQFKSFAEQQAQALSGNEADFLRQAATQLDGFRRINICVVSFCEDFDLLSQWRSYGNDGRGIALGFETTQLAAAAKDHNLRLVRCIYDQGLHVQIARDLISLLLESYRIAHPQTADQCRDLIGYFNTTFLLTAPVIKDHHFAEEREWRLVSMPRSTLDPQITALLRGSHASVKFVLPLCKDTKSKSTLISSITIGPTLDPSNVADAIDVLAEKNGFQISSLSFSRIPYRGRH